MRSAVLVGGTVVCDCGVGPCDDRQRSLRTLAARAPISAVRIYLDVSIRESRFLEWHYLIESMYCVKGSLSVDQARDIFLKYSQEHPQRLRERAPHCCLRHWPRRCLASNRTGWPPRTLSVIASDEQAIVIARIYSRVSATRKPLAI